MDGQCRTLITPFLLKGDPFQEPFFHALIPALSRILLLSHRQIGVPSSGGQLSIYAAEVCSVQAINPCFYQPSHQMDTQMCGLLFSLRKNEYLEVLEFRTMLYLLIYDKILTSNKFLGATNSNSCSSNSFVNKPINITALSTLLRKD